MWLLFKGGAEVFRICDSELFRIQSYWIFTNEKTDHKSKFRMNLTFWSFPIFNNSHHASFRILFLALSFVPWAFPNICDKETLIKKLALNYVRISKPTKGFLKQQLQFLHTLSQTNKVAYFFAKNHLQN